MVLSVVWLLGLVVLAGVCGFIAFGLLQLHPDERVVTVLASALSAALGAISALLVSSHTSVPPTQPVNVVNSPAEPVPTTDTTAGDPSDALG